MKKLPHLKGLFAQPVWVIGLLFLGFNSFYSYAFYQVNSFKLGLALIFGLLILGHFITHTKSWVPKGANSLFLCLFMPILVTLPGALFGGFKTNYNLPYELGGWLLLWVWAYYLFQALNKPESFETWLDWLGISLVLVTLWATLEKAGVLGPGSILAGEVKASFGHRNYFSSYLTLMVPLFFALFMPVLESGGKFIRWVWPKKANWYLALFILSAFSLWFAETRAAIAGTVVALFILGMFQVGLFYPDKYKKKLIILVLILAGVLVAGLLVYGLNSDNLFGSRLAQLFGKRAWIGRIIPWQAALAALSDSPVLGHGLGSSYNLFFSFVDPASRLYHHERSYNHTHSEVLEFLAEGGMLAAFSLLLTWALVFRALWRVLKESKDPNHCRLALGLGGAVLAFWIHASFSVAPRMMVARLPWALTLALVFALEAQLKAQPKLSVKEIRGFGLLNGLSWIAAASLLIPWLVGQYQFMLFQSLPSNRANLERFEPIAYQSGDMYALDFLVHAQAEKQMLPQMQKTIKIIESKIPHYRNLDYQKAVLALYLGKPELARKQAQEAQRFDRYDTPTIRLLLSLAIEENDLEAFTYQFGLLTKRLLYRNFVVVAFDEDKVIFERGATSEGISFKPLGEGLRVNVDLFWLNQLLSKARALRQEQPSEAEKGKTLNELAQWLAQNSFFRLEIKPEQMAHEAEVYAMLDQYRQLSAQFQREKEFIDFSLSEELRSYGQAGAKGSQARHQEKLAQAQAKFESEKSRLETQLNEYSEFRHFLDKHKFAGEWLSEIGHLYFP